MNGVRGAITAVLIALMLACPLEAALARSASLTTTIVIRVLPDPVAVVEAQDGAGDMLRDIIRQNRMREPLVKTDDVSCSGERVYTIADRL